MSDKTQSGDKSPHSKTDWPHAPLHRLSTHGTYCVTAGTLHKAHVFCGPRRLDLLEQALLRVMKEHGWQLEAWAVFSNHYHFVAHAPENAADLRAVIKRLHGSTAHDVNRLDHASGRAVWHNFWDTALTFEKSYLARLNYVHHNAVKHGLVRVANQYRWCSAGWFEQTATRAQVHTLYRFKTDRLRIDDDYTPLGVTALECGDSRPILDCGDSSPLSSAAGGRQAEATANVLDGGDSSPLSFAAGGRQAEATANVLDGGDSSPLSSAAGGRQAEATANVLDCGDSSPLSFAAGGRQAEPTTPTTHKSGDKSPQTQKRR